VGHGVREVNELCYRDLFTGDIFEDELIGEMARTQILYYPTVTREPFERQGRLTDLIGAGQIFRDLGIDQTRFDPELDRVMICGSMDMTKDMARVCEEHGLIEGSNAEPGDFVFEKAFVG
jgi:ferredoxin--NADP+ reductase